LAPFVGSAIFFDVAARLVGGRRIPMRLTLEYWPDDGGYVGRLREVPGVFSQGDTLEDLEDNIRDAYELVQEDALGRPVPLAR
jgi:predicted RNase H-like HicB family nuclease